MATIKLRNTTNFTLVLQSSTLNPNCSWQQYPPQQIAPQTTVTWVCHTGMQGMTVSGSLNYKIADNLPVAIFSWDTIAGTYQGQVPSGYSVREIHSDVPNGQLFRNYTAEFTFSPQAAVQKQLRNLGGLGNKTKSGTNQVDVDIDGTTIGGVQAVEGLEMRSEDLTGAPPVRGSSRQITLRMTYTQTELSKYLALTKAKGPAQTITLTVFDGAGRQALQIKLINCIPTQIGLPMPNVHDLRGTVFEVVYSFSSMAVS